MDDNVLRGFTMFVFGVVFFCLPQQPCRFAKTVLIVRTQCTRLRCSLYNTKRYVAVLRSGFGAFGDLGASRCVNSHTPATATPQQPRTSVLGTAHHHADHCTWLPSGSFSEKILKAYQIFKNDTRNQERLHFWLKLPTVVHFANVVWRKHSNKDFNCCKRRLRAVLLAIRGVLASPRGLV